MLEPDFSPDLGAIVYLKSKGVMNPKS